MLSHIGWRTQSSPEAEGRGFGREWQVAAPVVGAVERLPPVLRLGFVDG